MQELRHAIEAATQSVRQSKSPLARHAEGCTDGRSGPCATLMKVQQLLHAINKGTVQQVDM